MLHRPRLLSWAAAFAAASLFACGSAEEAPVAVSGPLVELGDWSANPNDLIAYYAKLPDPLRPTGTPEETIRSLLSSLIDRQIMIVEGESLGYHQDPEFLSRQAMLRSKRLVEMVSQRVVSPNVEVTQADVEKMYHEFHWDREILPAHILSATEEDAYEVIALLDEGQDFTAVAKERSIAPDAEAGGFLGQYFGPNDAVEELVQAAYGLPVGEFTRKPVRTKDGWEVVKVLDATHVPLEQVRPQLMRGIYLGKFVGERRAQVARLWDKFGVEVDPKGLQLLIEAGNSGQEVEGEDAATPVIHFADRSLDVAEFQRFIVRSPVLPENPDSTAVIDLLLTRVLSDTLLHQEAIASGLDTLPEFSGFRENLYRRMIVTFLRKRAVLETITLTEEDVKQEYERGKDSFFRPDQISAHEVLVATRAEAQEVVRRLQAGDDPEALARTLSLRPDAVRSNGHVHITENDGDTWGEHFAGLWDTSEGDIVGPLEMSDGFVVLRIGQVQKDVARTYAEMRAGLMHRLKLNRTYNAFESYIEGLRQRYVDQVVWHDDRIRTLASQPPWAPAVP